MQQTIVHAGVRKVMWGGVCLWLLMAVQQVVGAQILGFEPVNWGSFALSLGSACILMAVLQDHRYRLWMVLAVVGITVGFGHVALESRRLDERSATRGSAVQ